MKAVFFFCSVLFCICLNAQTKIFTGYYVNANGDTVRGNFPKYGQWSRNPDKVDFLPAGQHNATVLTPSNCIVLSIDNYDEYLSFSGKRLINPIDDDAAMNNIGSFFDSRDSVASVTVFLRVVTKTPQCEIFILNDGIRTNFYYKLPGQNLNELRFKKYLSENHLREMFEYRQQLNNLFQQEIAKNNLEKQLEELPYTEEAIENFIRDLSGVKRQKAKNANTKWIVVAGASVNFFDVTGDRSIDEVNSKFENSFAPFVSVGYIIPVERNFNRIFIYPQLRAYNYKNSGKHSTSYSTRIITYQSRFCVLPEINAGVNIVNKPDLHFFLYGGAGMSFMVKTKKTDQRIISDNHIMSSNDFGARMAFTLNVSGGVTIKNRFLVTGSYHAPVTVANFAAYSPMYSNLQIGAGYKFR